MSTELIDCDSQQCETDSHNGGQAAGGADEDKGGCVSVSSLPSQNVQNVNQNKAVSFCEHIDFSSEIFCHASSRRNGVTFFTKHDTDHAFITERQAK